MTHFTIFGTRSWQFHQILNVIYKDESLREIAIRFISELWTAQNSLRGFIPLSCKKLRKKFGTNLPAVARTLQLTGYIKIKPYKVGSYCKQYQLTEQTTQFKFEPIGEYDKKEYLLERDFAVEQLPAVYRRIYENSQKTRFDARGAREFLKINQYESLSALNWRENFITLIESKDWPLPHIDRFGRFHYFWTATPRDLRSFFASPDGDKLLHIDVSGAQVCLHASLYPEGSIEKPRFIEMCQSGMFWNKINTHLGGLFNLNDEDSKRKLKEAVFQDIFYAWRTYESKYTEAFACLWPELARLIINVRKNRMMNKMSHISTEMQALESDIIIKTAIKSVIDKRADAYICSLHDCVICTEDVREMVKDALNNAFITKLGFAPKLKEDIL